MKSSFEIHKIINAELIMDIINNTKYNGKDYYIFREEIEKCHDYIELDKGWKPEFYGAFDKNSGICMGLIEYTTNYNNGEYPHLLCVQSLGNYAGMKLIMYVLKKLKNENYKGATIRPYKSDLEEYYEKNYGFKKMGDGLMKVTFDNSIFDNIKEHRKTIKFKKKLNEGVYGGVAMDQTFGASYGVQGTSGYVYSIKPLSFNLQGHVMPKQPSFRYIHKGCEVTSRDKNGNDVKGRIYRIVKDMDGYITQVYIFNDRTGRIIPINIDKIELVNYNNKKSLIITEMLNMSDDKLLLTEAVKKQGLIEAKNNNGRFIATLSEGLVHIIKTKYINDKEYVIGFQPIFESDDKIIKVLSNGIK